MKQWTPCVGQTIPLVASLSARVLDIDGGIVTLGFEDANGSPSKITSLSSRQRIRGHGAWVFVRSGEAGRGHMMVIRCGAGQRIRLYDNHELIVERTNGSSIRLSMVELFKTEETYKTNGKMIGGDHSMSLGYLM